MFSGPKNEDPIILFFRFEKRRRNKVFRSSDHLSNPKGGYSSSAAYGTKSSSRVRNSQGSGLNTVFSKPERFQVRVKLFPLKLEKFQLWSKTLTSETQNNLGLIYVPPPSNAKLGRFRVGFKLPFLKQYASLRLLWLRERSVPRPRNHFKPKVYRFEVTKYNTQIKIVNKYIVRR